MHKSNRAALPFVTVNPAEPLRLVSPFFRSDAPRQKLRPPGWHDLLVMVLVPEAAARLVRAYDYAKEIRAELYQRDIIRRGESEPRIEVPVSVPVFLHSTACADGSAWDLVNIEPWAALPAAFESNLLGSPNPDCSDELLLQPVLQLHRNQDMAHLRINTNLTDEHLPESFFTEDVPIDALRRWQRDRRWSGSFVLRDDVNYAGH